MDKDTLSEGHNGHKSIRLPFTEEEYERLLSDAGYFRTRLDFYISQYPDLFPADISVGYQLWSKIPASKKQGIAVRRIMLKNAQRSVYQIYPSFVMPYMTARSEEAWKILLLGQYAVPHWVIAKIFERDEKHIERMCRHFGNCSLVGSTVRGNTQVPKDLVADEKHTRLEGEKAYIATIGAEDCFLCAGLTSGADEAQLTVAYKEFASQAQDMDPDYQAHTVNTDGWKPTVNAMKNVFGGTITIIACFLHALLSIQNVATKKSAELLGTVKEKVWNIYRAKDKHTFAQRTRRLREWAGQITCERIKEKVLKLCGRKYDFMLAYDFDKAHRTSNMIDRMMDFMDKFLYNRKYLKGQKCTAAKSITAFCIAYNFRPYSPAVVKQKKVRSPFEKLNGFQYHDNWLQNMLIATSRNGYRRSQQKKT